MQWQKYADELKKLLGIKNSPVAVTFSRKPAAGVEASEKAKYRICNSFFEASKGKTFDIHKGNSVCGGGSYYMGFTPTPQGEAGDALKDFLIDGEKLCKSLAVYHRMLSRLMPPPLGLAKHIIISPMEKAEFEPDVVIFICNAFQGSRILTLDQYERGISPKTEMMGATCHQAIGYPMSSGEINVTLMDYTSRKIKDVTDNELVVSVPYHLLHGIMQSIPRCTAGTAKFEMPESFKKQFSAEVNLEQ